jgi:uncharacterized protein YidB (DUF937 family)
MDDLAKILGGAGGSATGAASEPGPGGDIVGALTGLVSGQGGLESLLGRLQAGGLGDQVASWVGTGPNQSVDPAKLGHALGDEQVQELSTRTGLPIAQLLPMLASLLPTIIDTLTPDGRVPSGDAAAGLDVGGLLEGLAGAAQGGPGGPLGGLGDLLGGLTGGSKPGS